MCRVTPAARAGESVGASGIFVVMELLAPVTLMGLGDVEREDSTL